MGGRDLSFGEVHQRRENDRGAECYAVYAMVSSVFAAYIIFSDAIAD